jgi:hypothetical protein
VTFGSGFPSAWQHFPSNREADTFVSDSHHQNAGWGRSKVPFGSVESRHVWPLIKAQVLSAFGVGAVPSLVCRGGRAR